jgi:hypothetical protein
MKQNVTLNPPPAPSPWRKVPQLAARLGCCNKQVYLLCATGKLRHARIGRGIRGRDEWCDEFLLSTEPVEVTRGR